MLKERSTVTEQERYTTPTDWSKYRLLDRMLKCAEVGPGAYCCEIGCGAGIFLSELERRGIKAVGIDTSDDAIEIASGRFRSSALISVRKQSVGELEEKFDAVFMFEVLEHVDDDKGFLKIISDRILKKDGAIFISVPSKQWLYSKADRYYGHLRRYEKRDLCDKLKRAGLEPVIFWSFGLLPVHIICQHLLFRGFYERSANNGNAEERTKESGVLKFPTVWKALYPIASKFYEAVLFIEKALLNTDMGYSYLVYCRKRR